MIENLFTTDVSNIYIPDTDKTSHGDGIRHKKYGCFQWINGTYLDQLFTLINIGASFGDIEI